MPAVILPSKPDFSLEKKLGGIVCGIDEVGRGPLAGPVVAAAVILIPEKIPPDILNSIDDSKKLTAAKRKKIAEALPGLAHTAIGEASVAEIDAINILQASFLAMQRAFEKLAKTVTPDFALIDGNRAPKLPCKCHTIVGGDRKSLSIAAASIIAKHYRDMKMTTLAKEHPHYGWEKNAGYGTAQHLQALESCGLTSHHRLSFAPIAKLSATN